MLCHTPDMALPNPIVQSPYSTFYHISFQVYFRSSISIERTSRDVFSLFLTSFDQDQTKKFLQGWTKMTLFHITGTTQYVYSRAKYRHMASNYHMLKCVHSEWCHHPYIDQCPKKFIILEWDFSSEQCHQRCNHCCLFCYLLSHHCRHQPLQVKAKVINHFRKVL